MQRWEGEADLGTWKTATKKTFTFLSPLLLFPWMVGEARRRQMAMMVSLVPVLQMLLNWKSDIKRPFTPCLSPPLGSYMDNTMFHLFVEIESGMEMLPACFSIDIPHAGLCPQE